MSDDSLTLEKLKLNERVTSIEEHILDVAKSRDEMNNGFKEIKNTVQKIEKTLYGSEDKTGVIHTLNDINNNFKVAIKILGWMLGVVGTSVLMYSMPKIFEFLAKATAHGS